MMLARVFLLAVLGAQQGTLALPTPHDVAHEATESVASTGCAQELATAFAALPAACGVDAAEDDAFESGAGAGGGKREQLPAWWGGTNARQSAL